MAKGINFLLYVNTGTDATPAWTKVAGQRGATLNREYDTIDITTKDSDGFTDEDYSFGTWGIEADGLLVESDSGYAYLEDAFENAEFLKVRFETLAGNKYEGNVLITDFPIEAPYDDAVTYSITLNGKGKYTKVPVA